MIGKGTHLRQVRGENTIRGRLARVNHHRPLLRLVQNVVVELPPQGSNSRSCDVVYDSYRLAEALQALFDDIEAIALLSFERNAGQLGGLDALAENALLSFIKSLFVGALEMPEELLHQRQTNKNSE